MRSIQQDRDSEQRWILFQDCLDDLKPGEIVTIGGLVARTGVSAESVEMVLLALARADVLAQVDQTKFVRQGR